MYETFFGLKKRPFLTTPTLDRYFPTECMEQAFRTISRAVERGDGPVAVMGGTGVGKTLLCLRVADAWRRNFEVILLSSSKLCTRRALLQNLLFELRMPYRDMSEGELRLSLTDRLQPSIENSSDGLLLIVDEAQSLSIKLLEELRLLTNLVRDGVPRVRMVLVGSLRLDELIGHPRMESLNQRLASRCYLRTLTADETNRYLKHKLEISGAPAMSVFTEDALRMIHRCADGIPRLIDQLADHALCAAVALSQKPISGMLVERAWSELQQLPSPWMEATPTSPISSTTIEFGNLDEEEDKEFENLDAERSEEIHAIESLDQDEVFMELPTLDTFVFDSIEGEPTSSFGMVSYNSYDLSDQITIESTDSIYSFSDEPVATAQRGSKMSDQTLAADPFGDGFEEELPVPAQADTSAQPSLTAFEPDVISPLDSDNQDIPVEPLENALNLDVSTVENEIREMISSLNLSSNGLDLDIHRPAVLSDESPSETRMGTDKTSSSSNTPRTTPNSGYGASLLAFANLGSNEHFGEEGFCPFGSSDDRDLLVVEENLEMRHEQVSESNNYSQPTRTPPHSYVQLFSKLRG